MQYHINGCIYSITSGLPVCILCQKCTSAPVVTHTDTAGNKIQLSSLKFSIEFKERRPDEFKKNNIFINQWCLSGVVTISGARLDFCHEDVMINERPVITLCK